MLGLQDARAWHLSYHDGEHYNSVRLADDYEGPAQPIALVDGKVSVQPQKRADSRWAQQQIDSVRWGTGCEDVNKISAALETASGNTDAVRLLYFNS